MPSITIISSPYHLGSPNIGPGAGPNFLLSHGLASALSSLALPIRVLEIPPVDPSEFDGDIARSFEILRRTSAFVSQELKALSFPIVLAGNCTASVGAAAGIHASLAPADPSGRRLEDDEGPGRKEDGSGELGCIWFDAHDDFHTPDTFTSGYFDSMPIAMLAGLCWNGMLASVPGHRALNLERFAHVGMRDVTSLERKRVTDAGLDIIWGSQRTEDRVDFAGLLNQTLARKKLGKTMVHVDLDCLDASLGAVNKFAAPGGLLEGDLTQCLRRIVERTEPVSLTVASFDPACDPERAGRISEVAVEAVKGFAEGLVKKGVLGVDL